MKVLILESDDWQGLFINGNLIDEGHVLGEGNATTYLLEKAEEYGFKASDVRVEYIECDEDMDYLNRFGEFPDTTDELKGEY